MQVFHSTSCSIAYCAFWPWIKWMQSRSGCAKQVMLENKYTPERRRLESKMLSFIYPLLSSLSEATASLPNSNQTKEMQPKGAAESPPCPIHLLGAALRNLRWDNVHVNPTGRWWNAEQPLTAVFLSLGLSCLDSPFAGGRNTRYNFSHCASEALLGLCGALWMCGVWAKG